MGELGMRCQRTGLPCFAQQCSAVRGMHPFFSFVHPPAPHFPHRQLEGVSDQTNAEKLDVLLESTVYCEA